MRLVRIRDTETQMSYPARRGLHRLSPITPSNNVGALYGHFAQHLASDQRHACVCILRRNDWTSERFLQSSRSAGPHDDEQRRTSYPAPTLHLHRLSRTVRPRQSKEGVGQSCQDLPSCGSGAGTAVIRPSHLVSSSTLPSSPSCFTTNLSARPFSQSLGSYASLFILLYPYLRS